MKIMSRANVLRLAENAGMSEADMWDQIGKTYGLQQKLDEAIWCMQCAIECRIADEAK